MAARTSRQARLDAGERLDFLPETADVRDSAWQVAPAPADLQDRRVEITGPVDRKMVINALNSGARCFMADFEDANSPTWQNTIDGQANLTAAIDRRIDFTAPNGKTYALNDEPAVLIVRPRGWHLDEKHITVDGARMSASLVDFGLYLFHNAQRLIATGSGPYYYLPKLESHLEARLWNDVFVFAQDTLNIPRGTIRCTVLVETLPAVFEMEEILFELKDHIVGLNAGRWDYIFSLIKRHRTRPDFVLPDRSLVTMTVPFMHAYAQLLVKTCHKRGAHAMGGMAAFIPSRKDEEVNRVAMQKVREDKQREARMGFDGTWIAHPDLNAIAMAEFDAVLGEKPNQLERQRDDVDVSAKQILDVSAASGGVTEAGLRTNVEVALRYLSAWLAGNGAVGIHNLMEDAATAEISRAQVWQWVRHGTTMADGTAITRDFVLKILDEEHAALRAEDILPEATVAQARTLFEGVALADDFPEFLTLSAYEMLE